MHSVTTPHGAESAARMPGRDVGGDRLNMTSRDVQLRRNGLSDKRPDLGLDAADSELDGLILALELLAFDDDDLFGCFQNI